MSKKKHFFILATIVIIIAIRTYLMFDMDNGWHWLIPCFFGALGWVFIYAASRSK